MCFLETLQIKKIFADILKQNTIFYTKSRNRKRNHFHLYFWKNKKTTKSNPLAIDFASILLQRYLQCVRILCKKTFITSRFLFILNGFSVWHSSQWSLAKSEKLIVKNRCQTAKNVDVFFSFLRAIQYFTCFTESHFGTRRYGSMGSPSRGRTAILRHSSCFPAYTITGKTS